MFLHSGASLHGHEYSNKPVNQPPPQGRRRSPLLISPFTSSPVSNPTPNPPPAPAPTPSSDPASPTSSPAPVVRSNTTAVGALRRPEHLRPGLRRNSDGAVNTGSRLEHVVRFVDPVVIDSPSVLHSTTPPGNAKPGILSRPKESMSEDDSSYEASEASYASDRVARPRATSRATSRATRRRHAQRKSTTFLLCQPAPKLRTKKQLFKHIRPTLLMQLQLVPPNGRPLPVIDVYPSSLLVGNVAAPRFSKRFPRLFGINGELGIHDTILVRSDDYYQSRPNSSDSEREDEDFEHQTLLAVLSPLRGESRSEIVLESGAVWVTSPLPNGSFDFVHVAPDGKTTTARWVHRPVSKSSMPVSPTAAASDLALGTCESESKFTFSIIDPNSRRHPIMATLTKTTLEILEYYTTVSPLANSRYPPSRSRTQSPTPGATDESNDEETPKTGSPRATSRNSSLGKGRTTLPVDPALKEIISITAVWVALQSGWGQSQSTTSHSGCIQRASSSICQLPEHANNDASKSSETMDARGRGSLPKSSSQSLAAPQNRDKSPSLSPRALLRNPLFPRHASSTGAAYVRRLQMADSSDSDRASFPRRSRTFSRFSIDNPTDKSTAGETRWAGVSPSPSLRRRSAALPPSRSDLRSLTTPALPSGGRSVSAYYATNPLTRTRLDEDTPIVQSPLEEPQVDVTIPALSAVSSIPVSVGPPSPLPVSIDVPRRSDSTADRAGQTKWKKLGNWFKRLGGH